MSPNNKKKIIFSALSGIIVVCITVLWFGLVHGETNSLGDSINTQDRTSDEYDDNVATASSNASPDNAMTNERQTMVEQVRFMSNLRKTWPKNPQEVLPSALHGEQMFADTPLASECAWVAVRCLTEMGRFDDAKEKSREMVERYPDSNWTMDVKRHLLTHPF